MTKEYLALALAGSLIASNATAASRCVGQQDEMAMRTAVLQQNLMVAALSCGDIARYNQFVTTHQSELQQSDKTLLAFFKRENGAARGTADYHAFKTKAANDSALQSARDGNAYCANAQQAYDVALNQGQVDLATFVRSQWNTTALYVSATCTDSARGERTAGGAAGYEGPAPHAPVGPVVASDGGN